MKEANLIACSFAAGLSFASGNYILTAALALLVAVWVWPPSADED